MKPFVVYGWAVLGVELVKVLRLQADKLVVGAMMGAETLGIYFMAFNAGLGLATSFTQAFSVVLFPHLCAAEDKHGALRHGLGLSLARDLASRGLAVAILHPGMVSTEMIGGHGDITADEAAGWGLVNVVAEDPREAALARAQDIAAKSPLARASRCAAAVVPVTAERGVGL